uniref:Anaphase-promoting complex subunit 5 n=1 Tax=Acrobeloides nanus TaxID=290746 RepID=A0A914E7T7_9BILA
MSQTIPESMSSSRFASRTTNSFTELLSSVNVNDYIQSQLLCMQMCPAKTLSYEKICQLCEFVRKNFSRIPTVHLLEMLNEVRAHNYAKANEAVQLFFDWIVIHGFEKYTPSMLKELDKDQRVLKYALILRARLARKFGYFERAHRYIMEAIQKAQSNDDYICLRLALVVQAESELNTLGLALTPTSTVFESHMPGFSYEGCLNRLKSLVSLQDDLPYESSRTSTDLKYAQEFSSQCHQVMNLIKAIFLIMKCENIEKVNEYLRECLSADLGIDRSPPGRMLHYAARATQSTLQLSLGFASNSNILSQDSMLMKVLGSSNFYDTESHAIMSVNVAYSLAYDGKFNEAILVIEELKKRFPEDAYPSGAKHWRLAEACLRFDRAVFLGHFNEANCIIEQHEPHYEMEIRKAILSGITGNLKQMQEKIESMSDMLNSFNVLLRIRTSLVLSQLYSFSGTPIQAIDLLTASLELARAHQLHNFVPMILRRLVYAQVSLSRDRSIRYG